MNDRPVQDNQSPHLDVNTRLAFENTFLAQERTQMAWVQVSLALMTFGFTIAKVFEFLREKEGQQLTLFGPRTVGILMIAIGLTALTLASVQHRRIMKSMRQECPSLPMSQAGILAVLLALLGILAFIGAILRH
jgi:inner membrane protein YidH